MGFKLKNFVQPEASRFALEKKIGSQSWGWKDRNAQYIPLEFFFVKMELTARTCLLLERMFSLHRQFLFEGNNLLRETLKLLHILDRRQIFLGICGRVHGGCTHVTWLHSTFRMYSFPERITFQNMLNVLLPFFLFFRKLFFQNK